MRHIMYTLLYVRYQVCMYLCRVLLNADNVLNKNRIKKKNWKNMHSLGVCGCCLFSSLYAFQIVWWFIYSLTCDQTGNCFDFFLSPSSSLVVRSIFVICETLLITVSNIQCLISRYNLSNNYHCDRRLTALWLFVSNIWLSCYIFFKLKQQQ